MGWTVLQLADRLRDEADAYEFLEELRWGDGLPVCPHCNGEGATYLNPENGKSRATRTGAQSQRRVWQCWDCRKQFSVLTGTVMHGTRVSVRVWVMVMFEMVSSKNGVSAREVERKYGVCSRTAWHLLHRIREAMTSDPLAAPMSGVVVADETFIGGAPKNRHASKRGPKFSSDKTPVLSLINAETGEARSRIVPDVTGASLSKAMSELGVHRSATTLYTDSSATYDSIDYAFEAHETVNHNEGEYVRYVNGTVITSNAAENFFSQLKRSLDGTHHHVSRTHLPRYLAEFDFRYTTKDMSDTDRMGKLVGQCHGKRLTYKRVTTR
jgi:transposase-like protein